MTVVRPRGQLALMTPGSTSISVQYLGGGNSAAYADCVGGSFSAIAFRVPEPSSCVLTAMGSVALILFARRRSVAA
jgi:hypothetical protein